MFSTRPGIKVMIIVLCFSVTGYIYLYSIYSSSQSVGFFYWKQQDLSRISSKKIDFVNERIPLPTLFTTWPECGRKLKIWNWVHLKPVVNPVFINTDGVNDKIPLLTLFTTWPSGGHKHQIWNATMKNWAYFKAVVRPVFFNTNERQTQDILKHGWEVLSVSKMAANEAPVLKHMFLDVMKKFNSSFYGFANGDILFDEGLINTLHSVLKQRLPTQKPVLITGIRTNVPNMTEKETNNNRNLAKVAKRRGQLFIPDSQDYFITDPSYPWADIAEVVIGRRGFDNWLVMHARQLNHTVIDATQTVVAVHQTTSAGDYENLKHKDNDYNINLLLKLYKSVRYRAGCTFCATWRTMKGQNNSITVTQRKTLVKSCFPLF